MGTTPVTNQSTATPTTAATPTSEPVQSATATTMAPAYQHGDQYRNKMILFFIFLVMVISVSYYYYRKKNIAGGLDDYDYMD